MNNGLFKYLVLPPRITGAMLLQLSSQAGLEPRIRPCGLHGGLG